MYPKVAEADGIMHTCREILEKEHVDVQEHKVNMILGCADMSLVACTLNIKVPGEKVYKTTQGMAHDFVGIACGVLGKTFESPWKAWEEVDTSQPAPAVKTSTSSMLREVKKDGSVHPEVVLKEAGFEVGTSVKRKADSVGQSPRGGLCGRCEDLDWIKSGQSTADRFLGWTVGQVCAQTRGSSNGTK